MSLDVVLILFQIVVLVFSFSLHEVAHAYVAMRLGDMTAYMLGRVTLNPAKHIDPFGSILMPVLGLFWGGALLGWGKPTPVTMRNFKHPKRDDILVILAGPASNLLMAAAALMLLIVLKHTRVMGAGAVYAAIAMTNHAQLDLHTLPTMFPLALLLYYGVVLNCLLFCFNLIPVPPLDGSRLMRYVLPYNVLQLYDRIGLFGSLALFWIAGRLILPTLYPPLLGAFDGLLLWA